MRLGHGYGYALAATTTAVAFLAAGCLTTSYRIPREDLQALASTPPEQRGARVRVIQTFQGDEPPAAPPVRDDTVVVYTGVYVDGPRGGHVGGHSHGGNLAKAAKDDAKAWFVLAAILAIGFAVTEGARYDGWVKLHPMHPVHLYGAYGEYRWVPLAQLDPGTAAWARRAYVREGEGPWLTLGRAPLNRVGWTYSLLFGASEFPSQDNSERRGFMGHIQVGLFPVQQVGVLLDFAMGWTENSVGDTVFDGRNALEVQFLPLSAGRFHAGGFGQIGIGTRIEDGYHGDDDRGLLLGGGVLLQLELTTRLTITGRFGMTSVHGETPSDFTLGLSIY